MIPCFLYLYNFQQFYDKILEYRHICLSFISFNHGAWLRLNITSFEFTGLYKTKSIRWDITDKGTERCNYCAMFIRMVVSMTYYGLSLNTGNLGGDFYVNFLISGVVEFPAYTLCLLLLDRWGRKKCHCSAMLLGGIACLCTIFTISFGGEGNWSLLVVWSFFHCVSIFMKSLLICSTKWIVL